MNRKTAILIAIASVLAVYVFLIEPLSEKRKEIHEQLQMDYVTLVKHENFIKKTEKADIEIDQAREELAEMEKYIVHSTDKSLAFAKLQAKIQDLSSAARLRISTIKLLPTVAHKGYVGLPIYIDCIGDIENLSRFLNFLDSSREFIGIERIDISTTPQGELRIKFQLAGLMKS